MKSKKKCEYCGKEFKYYISMHPNRKFHSIKCRNKYWKKYKIGFWNLKSQSNLGKRVSAETHSIGGKNAQKTLKKLKKGLYNPETGRKGGKAAQKTLKKLKLGLYNPDNRKKGVETNRRQGTGLFSPKIQEMGNKAIKFETRSKAGKIGGVNSQKTLRQNVRNLPFKGQLYDSPDEIEISICLQKQYNYKPKEGITLHIGMNGGEIDFLLENLELFVEEHRYFKNETLQQYTNRRRKILNENGYKNYKLMIIK